MPYNDSFLFFYSFLPQLYKTSRYNTHPRNKLTNTQIYITERRQWAHSHPTYFRNKKSIVLNHFISVLCCFYFKRQLCMGHTYSELGARPVVITSRVCLSCLQCHPRKVTVVFFCLLFLYTPELARLNFCIVLILYTYIYIFLS